MGLIGPKGLVEKALRRTFDEAASQITYEEFIRLWESGEYRNLDIGLQQALHRRYGTPFQDPEHWLTATQGIPDSLKGKPVKVWGNTISGGLAPHTLVDQMRYFSGVALLEIGQIYELPLADENLVPFLDPASPPKLMVRATTINQSGSDPVVNPRSSANSDATRYIWNDAYTMMPLLAEDSGQVACEWSLRLKRQPYPHWVVRLAYNTNDSSPSDFMAAHVAALGEGAGRHMNSDHTAESYEIEEGSSWTHGHSKRALVFQELGTPVHSRDVVNGTQAEMNRASLMYGVSDETSGTVGGNTLVYLARPGGLSTDTNIFTDDYPPFCMVFAEGDRTTRSNTQTAWRASSLGMAPFIGTNANKNPVFFPRYAYESQLSYSHANSRWQINMFNLTGVVPSTPSTSRSFYFWALSGD